MLGLYLVVGCCVAAESWEGEWPPRSLADVRGVVGLVVGWPVLLLPWREWLFASKPGTHRLAR